MPSLRRIGFFVAVFFLTGVVFWTPDVIFHAIVRQGFDWKGVLLLTILLPVATCAVGAVLFFRRRKDALVSSLVGTLGIWVTGPLFMMISASFEGGGFNQPGGLSAVVLLTLLFPISTFSFSTYDGTLFAVLAITVCLPVTGSRLSHSR